MFRRLAANASLQLGVHWIGCGGVVRAVWRCGAGDVRCGAGGVAVAVWCGRCGGGGCGRCGGVVRAVWWAVWRCGAGGVAVWCGRCVARASGCTAAARAAGRREASLAAGGSLSQRGTGAAHWQLLAPAPLAHPTHAAAMFLGCGACSAVCNSAFGGTTQRVEPASLAGTGAAVRGAGRAAVGCAALAGKLAPDTCGKRWHPCGAAARRIGCAEKDLLCSPQAGPHTLRMPCMLCSLQDFCASPADTLLGAPRCLPLPARCGARNNACCPPNKDGAVRERWLMDAATPVPYCTDAGSFCVWRVDDYRQQGLGALNAAGGARTLSWDGYFGRGYGASRCAPLPPACGGPGEPCCPSMIDQRISGMVHNRRFRHQPCDYAAAGRNGVYCRGSWQGALLTPGEALGTCTLNTPDCGAAGRQCCREDVPEVGPVTRCEAVPGGAGHGGAAGGVQGGARALTAAASFLYCCVLGCAAGMQARRGNRLQDKPFHVPGHKRGRALDPGMRQLLGLQPSTESASQQQQHNPLRYDLTELSGLDYLSSPSGVIAAAQQAASAAFGADHTWLLVNGCSAGIHAAVLATVRPGQALLLARNCHMSAFAACVLAGVRPVWLQPAADAAHGVAHCVTPGELAAGFKAAAAQGLVVGAALVVSPTYYGAVAHVRELADLCHGRGVPLLVDEAHGGHLRFLAQQQQQQQPADGAAAGAAARSTAGSDVPLPALACGADLVAQSSHKVLSAMTQAAMLHSRGGRVDPARVGRALQVLQTSSPSYLLLASLDAARRHAAAPGAWRLPLAAAAAARAGLQAIPSLLLLQQGSCGGGGGSVAGWDPLRLVVNVSALALSGFAAAEWLEQQHSIVPELATAQLVVFVVGPGSCMADAEALVAAFARLDSLLTTPGTAAASQQLKAAAAAAEAAGSSSTTPVPGKQALNCPESAGSQQQQQQQQQQVAAAAMSPRDAFFADTQAVPLAAAAGRICAELLCPYPPGVPAVFPGEALSAGVIAQLRATLAAGGVVTGARDGSLDTVLVVAAQHADDPGADPRRERAVGPRQPLRFFGSGITAGVVMGARDASLDTVLVVAAQQLLMCRRA
ncbi:pyridoxal phosphate-dependent transferase [Scenedesmus sp. NREL 46B-D3]|nr:pyridoxal phosphate-dependent transferase [Scenedesmus sp. NREL 46B-D3]